MYIYIYISSLFHPVSLFQRWLELLVASCFTPPFLSSNLLEEQRNTQIFILNNLHFFPLTFLTQISNPLFVKDFSHNLAYIYIYINHTKYQEKCQLGFSTNTRIKRNRSGERRRNWNEIITLKATGLRRRAGMDKKKRNYSSGIKENAVGLCPEKCTRPFLRTPPKTFPRVNFSPSLSNFRLERERKKLLFHRRCRVNFSRFGEE